MSGYVGLVQKDGVTPVDSTNPLNVVGGTGASANQEQGNVAAAAADTGNPVKVGARYDLTVPTYTDGQRTNLQTDSKGNLKVAMFAAESGTGSVAIIGLADGQSNGPSVLVTGSRTQRWNGATYDREYGNFDATALTLTAQAAGTVNGTDQTNYNGRGVNVVVDITAATAMTLTVNIQFKDVASGKYVTVLSSTALAATGTTMLSVFPGATVTANVSANAQLSRTWRAQAVVTGTSVTATIGASVIQ